MKIEASTYNTLIKYDVLCAPLFHWFTYEDCDAANMCAASELNRLLSSEVEAIALNAGVK